MGLSELINPAIIPILLLLGMVMWRATGLAKMGFGCLLRGMKAAFSGEKSDGSLSGYETLVTSLAATIGTANVAGAAAALLIGGPGALFWMWICGLLGMAIKYAEAVLAVKYARRGRDGARFGGPMYCMESTMGRRGKCLALAYCCAGVFSALATGALWQTSAAAEIIEETAQTVGLSLSGDALRLIVGLCGAAIAAPVVSGGGKAAVKSATKVVPLMCLGYVAATVTMIIANIDRLPGALVAVIGGVLDPAAATGGVLGGGIAAIVSTAASGIQTGVFSSEAGLGSAAISYAASGEGESFTAGCCGMIEVFVDTMLLCTLTVLSVLCCIAPGYGGTGGVATVFQSFSLTFGPSFAGAFLTASICMFALSSIFTWSWYGQSCLEYITLSPQWRNAYRIAFLAAMLAGAFGSTGKLNGAVALSNLLLVLPNAALLLFCRGEIAAERPVSSLSATGRSCRCRAAANTSALPRKRT